MIFDRAVGLRSGAMGQLLTMLRSGFGSARVVVFVAVAAVALAACGEEPPSDFSPTNRADFMAACSEPLEDGPLVTSVCQCVFERSQDEIVFADFVDIEAALRADPAVPLPIELTDLVAECFIEAAEL